MEANDSKTQTPNLVAKVAALEKQNRVLLRRIGAMEKSHRELELAVRMLRTSVQAKVKT